MSTNYPILQHGGFTSDQGVNQALNAQGQAIGGHTGYQVGPNQVWSHSMWSTGKTKPLAETKLEKLFESYDNEKYAAYVNYSQLNSTGQIVAYTTTGGTASYQQYTPIIQDQSNQNVPKK